MQDGGRNGCPSQGRKLAPFKAWSLGRDNLTFGLGKRRPQSETEIYRLLTRRPVTQPRALSNFSHFPSEESICLHRTFKKPFLSVPFSSTAAYFYTATETITGFREKKLSAYDWKTWKKVRFMAPVCQTARLKLMSNSTVLFYFYWKYFFESGGNIVSNKLSYFEDSSDLKGATERDVLKVVFFFMMRTTHFCASSWQRDWFETKPLERFFWQCFLETLKRKSLKPDDKFHFFRDLFVAVNKRVIIAANDNILKDAPSSWGRKGSDEY